MKRRSDGFFDQTRFQPNLKRRILSLDTVDVFVQGLGRERRWAGFPAGA